MELFEFEEKIKNKIVDMCFSVFNECCSFIRQMFKVLICFVSIIPIKLKPKKKKNKETKKNQK